MKRVKLGAVLAMVALLGTFAPAMAADEEPLEMVTQGSLMFTRMGGVGAGLVLGTPVAIIRQSVKRCIGFTNAAADKVGDKAGGHECGPVCLACSLVTLPAGIVVGSLEGVYYGAKNGVVTGFNQPFHPDSFSLGELEGE